MLDEVVGFERHIEGQVFLQVAGDLGVLQRRAVATGEFFSERLDVTVEFLLRHDLGHQTDPLRFDPSEISTGQRYKKGFLKRYTRVK